MVQAGGAQQAEVTRRAGGAGRVESVRAPGPAGGPKAAGLTPATAAAGAPVGEFSPEERRALATKVAFLNGVLDASAVSWTGLLAELEAALPAEASLTEIQPDRSAGRIRLTGLAATPDAVAEFVRRLEVRPAFRDVFLLQQAEKAGVAPGGAPAVAFSVSLAYRSAR